MTTTLSRVGKRLRSHYTLMSHVYSDSTAIMPDWQTIAVGLCVLAAVAWLVRALWPHRSAATPGCGTGCGDCPSAAAKPPAGNDGFVGLDVLRQSTPDLNSPRGS